MDDGVLCLKWRDHRSTFLRMLSSIRKKGVFCDATLACEGRFYPVHRLVLSTCSEYFQHMFEVVDGVGGGRAGGALAGPLVVVLADILPCDLEALLEYMYAGEATIMQGDLSRFMRAAEGLKVRGLAEPPPQAATSTPRRESGEGKRPLSQHEDTWEAKRRREDVRPVKEAKEAGQEIVSPAQLAAVELAPEAQGGAGRGLATAAPGDHPGASAPNTLDRPQVKCEEEVQVKEEPEEWPQPGSEGGTADGLLAFSDPGLAYLAHTSGLGGATADPSPPQPARSHPPQQHPHLQSTLQPTPGWEAAGPSDTTFPQQPPGPLRAATQRRMGRPTSEIWGHYTVERTAGRTAVYCKYCAQKYGYPNATKMKIHVMKCSRCPEDVRRRLAAAAKLDEYPDLARPARTDEAQSVQANTETVEEVFPNASPDKAMTAKPGEPKMCPGVLAAEELAQPRVPSQQKVRLATPDKLSAAKPSFHQATTELLGGGTITTAEPTHHTGFPSPEKASSAKPEAPAQHKPLPSPKNPSIAAKPEAHAAQRKPLPSPGSKALFTEAQSPEQRLGTERTLHHPSVF